MHYTQLKDGLTIVIHDNRELKRFDSLEEAKEWMSDFLNDLPYGI